MMKKTITIILVLLSFAAHSQTFEIPKKYDFRTVKREWVLTDTLKMGFIKTIETDSVEQSLSDSEIPDEWFRRYTIPAPFTIGDTTFITTKKRKVDVLRSGIGLLYLERIGKMNVEVPNSRAHVIKESLKEAKRQGVTNVNAIWNFIYSDTITFPPPVIPQDTIQ